MKEHFRSIQTPAILCVLCIMGLLSSTSNAQAGTTRSSFDSALPIWLAGRETEKNIFVGFRTVFDCSEQKEPLLRMAASSIYRIYRNGQFIGHGPVREPHGYYRMDECILSSCQCERNVLAIEVAGYNVNSFYLLRKERQAGSVRFN